MFYVEGGLNPICRIHPVQEFAGSPEGVSWLNDNRRFDSPVYQKVNRPQPHSYHILNIFLELFWCRLQRSVFISFVVQVLPVK